MSSIENTVHEAMRADGHADYIQYANNPISALMNREREIAGRIIEVAVNSGLDRETVEDMLVGLGMSLPVVEMPTPFDEPVTTGESTEAPADVRAMLADMRRTIDAVLQAARDNGITIHV